jgi:hypothetical protein
MTAGGQSRPDGDVGGACVTERPCPCAWCCLPLLLVRTRPNRPFCFGFYKPRKLHCHGNVSKATALWLCAALALAKAARPWCRSVPRARVCVRKLPIHVCVCVCVLQAVQSHAYDCQIQDECHVSRALVLLTVHPNVIVTAAKYRLGVSAFISVALVLAVPNTFEYGVQGHQIKAMVAQHVRFGVG